MNLNNGCIEEILDINGALLLAHFEMNIFVFSLCIVMKKYLYFFHKTAYAFNNLLHLVYFVIYCQVSSRRVVAQRGLMATTSVKTSPACAPAWGCVHNMTCCLTPSLLRNTSPSLPG